MRRTIVSGAALLLAALLALSAGPPARAQPGPAMGAVGEYLYPHLHNLIWDPADPQRVFAASPVGGWLSADAGRTWAALSPDTPNLHYGRMLLDRPGRALYLYRWGDPGLYRSADFGRSWQRRSDAMYYQVALVPGRPGSLYALHGDWRLRRSDDDGATWRDLAQPLPSMDETVFAVGPAGEIYAIAGRRLFRSADGGQSWLAQGSWPDTARPRELLVAADGSLVASVASDDRPSVSARAIWRSADGGASWAAAPLPAARIAVLAAGDDGAIWAGSDDGRVWRSRDLAAWGGPAGWAELPVELARPVSLRADIPYTPAITDISPGPGGVVLIGTIHGVYRAASPAGPALLRARGLLPTAALPSAPVAAPADADARYFAETGHSLREPFLSAWRRAGGRDGLGLPRSEPFLERSLDSGEDELVQYFERGRLGMPPGRPAAIALGRLAPQLMAEAGLAFPAAPAGPGCSPFAATGQSVCPPFLGAWRALGGLGFLGYPLSPAIDGPAGAEQWFERGRLAQGAGGPYLCLIGSEELQARGWLP